MIDLKQQQELPEVSEQDLKDPMFDAVFNVIKNWDIERFYGDGLAHGNGSDVMSILTSIRSPLPKDERIENSFTYHKPIGNQQERYVKLRDTAKAYAYMIMAYCPKSREQSFALTKLEECVMWANASIARNEGAPPEDKQS